MSAYDQASILINRCKRILALVDTYVDCPTQDHRTTLRKALMKEFEPPATAPPVAAGSVDTAPIFWDHIRRIVIGIHNGNGDEDAAMGNMLAWLIAWGAQQREMGKQEALDLTVSVGKLRERAEKAEARLKELEEKLRNPNAVRFGDPLPEVKVSGCVFNAEAKDQHPNAIDPSDMPC